MADFTSFALPLNTKETKEGELFLQAGEYDDCHMLAPMGDEKCDENSFSNVSVNCKTFVYDRTIFEETLTSQFNLVRLLNRPVQDTFEKYLDTDTF